MLEILNPKSMKIAKRESHLPMELFQISNHLRYPSPTRAALVSQVAPTNLEELLAVWSLRIIRAKKVLTEISLLLG